MKPRLLRTSFPLFSPVIRAAPDADSEVSILEYRQRLLASCQLFVAKAPRAVCPSFARNCRVPGISCRQLLTYRRPHWQIAERPSLLRNFHNPFAYIYTVMILMYSHFARMRVRITKMQKQSHNNKLSSLAYGINVESATDNMKGNE